MTTGRSAALVVLIILAAVAVDARDPITVKVSTDHGAYFLGETIVVSAAAHYGDGSPVTAASKAQIEIKDGAHARLIRDPLVDLGGGSFRYALATDPSATAGVWEIKVKIEDTTHNKAEDTMTLSVQEGESPCLDVDGDGHTDASCGGDDCNDGDPTVYPGGSEICGDGIDQSCSGGDLPCGATHESLTWNGPGTCLQCHSEQGAEVHASVHYQWKGETPDMTNGSGPQGKIAGAVNSYCINILGNWNACGGCHVGRGALPEETPTIQQLENIDCMMCHQKAYRRVKVDGEFVPDETAMGMSMDEAARTVHLPERANCLQCHAKAGGGDAVKRGDLALAQIATTDRDFDVHMATTGANLQCRDCHTSRNHRIAGKGSDLRPTDLDVTVECSNCHGEKLQTGGHSNEYVDRHPARVACQTCHIPVYAKDASDTVATEATETHRTWLASHATAPPFHPAMDKANDLQPEYRFWNRRSDNYLLHDRAQLDPTTGRYPTSRPEGSVGDANSKLYPFKYKTAEQPIMNATGELIALDTSVFFATADAAAATEQGLINMGYSGTEAYSWVETDTFQMLNHEVSPSSQALTCTDCHGSTSRMDLQGELGYGLKASTSVVCTQCHGSKEVKPFTTIHDKHVKDKRFDCSWCHDFSRPERGLRMP